MQNEGFSDIELIKGCIAGNGRSQEMLYKRFFSFAMSVCIRYAVNQDDAMEIVNDSFIKVFDNLKNFDTSRDFKSWFTQILVNTIIDNYRKNFKHNKVLPEEYLPETIEREDTYVQNISIKDILKLLSQLPENYRIIFNLYEIEGYSHEEIGKLTGIATSTSRAKLTRAKKMLRKLYEKYFNVINKYYETV